MKTDYDVIVVGGGPAGSTASCYLAKAGLRTLTLEREVFPRPHVGESFVPATTRALGELGMLPKMEAAKFPRKYGAIWTSNASKADMGHSYTAAEISGVKPEDEADIRFEERAQEGINQNYTYHVDRGLFDKIFLEHAAELGAEVRQGVGVSEVDFSDPVAVKVKFKENGEDKAATCRVVVDASGRRTLLGNQLRFKKTDEVFDQYAIHTWFEDYDRGTAHSADYIHIHFLPLSNTWVWQIPITDRVTSFGVVTQKKNFTAAKKDQDGFFWQCVDSRPEIGERLRAAKQVKPFTVEGDYSYAMTQICGDRFVMVGDAARFVDPIFSSGVSIAMRCSQLASADIIEAFKTGDFSKKAFDNFEATIRRGTKNWYEFISLYYRLNVLFTYFIKNPKYRLDVLKLLQGELYDTDHPEVLTKMRDIVTAVENDPNHIWHKMLGSLTSKEFNPQF